MVGRVGGWGLCSPTVHVPFGGSAEGARQSVCQARQQGSVALLLVAETIIYAVVAAPTAAPSSVMIDSRYPSPPRQLVDGMKYDLELGDCASCCPPGRKTSREEILGFDNGWTREVW
jgi:hypothetical protein